MYTTVALVFVDVGGIAMKPYLQKYLQPVPEAFRNGLYLFESINWGRGFEPPTPWSRTTRSSQAEPRRNESFDSNRILLHCILLSLWPLSSYSSLTTVAP